MVDKLEKLKEAKAPQLATLAGVSRVTAWRWLAGRGRPSPLALQRLAQIGVFLQLPVPIKPRNRRTKK